MELRLFFFKNIAFQADQKQQGSNLLEEKMDLMELNSDQIDDVFTIKEILSVDDIDSIIYALKTNNWNIDSALRTLIQQISPKQRQSSRQNNGNNIQDHEVYEPKRHFYWKDEEKTSKRIKQSTDKQQHPDRDEIKRQNEEYQRIAHNHSTKEHNHKQAQNKRELVKKEAAIDREYFQSHSPKCPIHIKFRLPLKSVIATFDLTDPIQVLYRYVNGHLRDFFEDTHSRFDLLLSQGNSLQREMEEKLSGVFGVELAGVVVMVREIE